MCDLCMKMEHEARRASLQANESLGGYHRGTVNDRTWRYRAAGESTECISRQSTDWIHVSWLRISAFWVSLLFRVTHRVVIHSELCNLEKHYSHE